MDLKENETISISDWYKELKASKDPIVEWIDTEQNFIKAIINRINVIFNTDLVGNKNKAVSSYDISTEQANEIFEKKYNICKDNIEIKQKKIKKYYYEIQEILSKNKGNKDFDIFMQLIKKEEEEKTQKDKEMENHLINLYPQLQTISKKYYKCKIIIKKIELTKKQQYYDFPLGKTDIYDSLTNTDIKFMEFLLKKIVKNDSENGNIFYKLRKFEFEIFSEEDRKELIYYIKKADIIRKLAIDDSCMQRCIDKLENPVKFRFYDTLLEITYSMDILEDNLDEKEFNDLTKELSKKLAECSAITKEKLKNTENSKDYEKYFNNEINSVLKQKNK